MQVVTTLCAIAAGVGAVLLIVARLLAGHWSLAARWGAAVSSARPVLTLIVAAGVDARQPLLLRGGRLHPVPAVLVPADRDVPDRR